MKNICTFETACSLENAGFPRPPRAAGQYWYNAFGVLYFIAEVVAPGILIAVDIRKVAFMAIGTPLYFAPTAEDILRELPDTYALKKDHHTCGGFVCYKGSPLAKQCYENSAEACATEWLAINKKE